LKPCESLSAWHAGHWRQPMGLGGGAPGPESRRRHSARLTCTRVSGTSEREQGVISANRSRLCGKPVRCPNSWAHSRWSGKLERGGPWRSRGFLWNLGRTTIIERKSGGENEHPSNAPSGFGKSGLQKLISLTTLTRKSTPATLESTRWTASMLRLSTIGVSGDVNVPTGPLSLNVTLQAKSEFSCSIFDASARIDLTFLSLIACTA